MYNGVTLSLSAILGSAPCCNNKETKTSWPFSHATDSGVTLSLSAILGSAPCCNDTDTQTLWPCWHAMYNGVLLSLLAIQDLLHAVIIN